MRAPSFSPDPPLALLDSGLLPDHPLVGPPVEAWRTAAGEGEAGWQVVPGFGDLLGHGTACAALCRALAPGAPLLSVAVFDREPWAGPERLLAALRWVIRRGAPVINLSLGLLPEPGAELIAACAEAARAGIRLVVAAPRAAEALDPETLPGVAVAEADASLGFSEVLPVGEDDRRFRASPWPLPLPGVLPEVDFHGPSLSAARVSAYLWGRRGCGR